MRRPLLIIAAAAVSLCGPSCGWLLGRDYNVDKSSPGGTYRVKFDVRVKEEGPMSGGFTERGKIQYFKGAEVLLAHEWAWQDTWESTSIDNYPVFEWPSDNVLRRGRDRSGQPFLDEAIISNDTDEHLKYVSLTHSRSESLMVFDVAPRSRIAVRMSPEFMSDTSANTFLGYSGAARSGKEFQGMLSGKEPRLLADGPAKYNITISTRDIQ